MALEKQCSCVRKIKESWAQGKFLQRGTDVRRKRRSEPRLKKGLYRNQAKHCTVGWKKCEGDDNHVETRVKKYFYIDEVTERARKRGEHVSPTCTTCPSDKELGPTRQRNKR